MNLLVVDDPYTSVMLMRGLNIGLVTVLLLGVLFLTPHPTSRAAFVAMTTASVPLGLFLIASNNPSAWSVMGVATYWAFMLTALESTSKRLMYGNFIFATLAAIFAVGARADSALYVIIASVAVILLTYRRSRSIGKAVLRLRNAPVLAISVIALAVFATTSQSGVVAGGFSSGTAIPNSGLRAFTDRLAGLFGSLDAGATIAYVLYVPELIAGGFGGWALGWLDTPMPPLVVWVSFPIAFGLVLIGIRSIYRGKALAMMLMMTSLVAIPTWIAVTGGIPAGSYIQPRYIYPLAIAAIGIALLDHGRLRLVALSRIQWMTLAVLLVGAQSAALRATIRRFTTGTDVQGLLLNTGYEWWPVNSPSPMAVWFIGTLAYALLVTAALAQLDDRRARGNGQPSELIPERD